MTHVKQGFQHREKATEQGLTVWTSQLEERTRHDWVARMPTIASEVANVFLERALSWKDNMMGVISKSVFCYITSSALHAQSQIQINSLWGTFTDAV